MTPSEETGPSAIPSTHVSSDRLRVGDIGEVTAVGPCWRLAYDHCDHVQEFAREGLKDPEGAAFFVRRHYAQCLTCALANRPVAAETPNVRPDRVHLMLKPDELATIVIALRAIGLHGFADRLDKVLRQLGRVG